MTCGVSVPKFLLTQRLLDEWVVPPALDVQDIHDVRLPGLFLKVFQASGRRSWYVRFRKPDGRYTERKIGDGRILSLQDARRFGREILSSITLGTDPFAQRDQVRRVVRFAEFVELYYVPFIQKNKKSWKTDVSLLKNHLLPFFGGSSLGSITTVQVNDFIERKSLKLKPASCNRLINLLRFMLNLAVRWDFEGVTVSQFAGLRLLREDNARERYLTAAETQEILLALESSNAGRLKEIILMLILTGARKSEVLKAQWSHVNFKLRFWVIPENKSGRPRHVPLSDEAMKLLRMLQQEKRRSAFIFANPATGKPYVSIFKSWDWVRKRAGLPELRIHDLRHSFASFLINQGRSLYEVQKILGHRQVRTTQRYAHLDQKRLLEAVNVVPVRVQLPSSPQKPEAQGTIAADDASVDSKALLGEL